MAGNLLTLGRLGAVHVVTAAQMMVVQGRPGMEIDCCGPSRQQKDGNRPSTDLAPSRRSSASAFTVLHPIPGAQNSVRTCFSLELGDSEVKAKMRGVVFGRK
ncbi:hypothetical protein SNOG_10587 [Parastagonospora nodorum SN15]|uniref:Uncharacterized protein n=1 Tax=Phaeosphaeria nodorum (strain SN15 / ATCC MYA-4574 / FGSC 10173) TaxID=321614 RepID=Q0UCC7_PHANO|nr:hypothetical protein SNOG_10587 [Parastagonospora nodorum SN15]EAT81981.1 hypothetical protein SNOG_10587 [Parastagonospora nodorum SN15]